MALKRKGKSKEELEYEGQLKGLSSLCQNRGIFVRREKLSRGPAFRVKSGNCLFSRDNVLFIDKRLPPRQQVSMLVDYMVEFEFQYGEEELVDLAPSLKELLSRRSAAAA